MHLDPKTTKRERDHPLGYPSIPCRKPVRHRSEGGNAPPRQFEEAETGPDLWRIWPPQIRRPMPAFFPVLGMYPPGFIGDQLLTGSDRSVVGGNAPPKKNH